MSKAAMDLPPVVSQEEWEAARAELLAKEKAHMRESDALAAQRRRLPRVAFSNDYVLEGPEGDAPLLDMFEGRRQLIVYHFMFQPGGTPCGGCSMFADNLVHLAHLNARNTTFAFVSPASVGEIEAYKERMGWDVPWYSNGESGFNADCGVAGSFGISVFLREGGDIYRTYFTSNRAAEGLGTVWSLLDITPLGRQETWEDSPPGYPQTPPYEWWQLHDEYGS